MPKYRVVGEQSLIIYPQGEHALNAQAVVSE